MYENAFGSAMPGADERNAEMAPIGKSNHVPFELRLPIKMTLSAFLPAKYETRTTLKVSGYCDYVQLDSF